MVITINTDAAYHHHHRIGAYAFWIASDKGRIKMAGVLRKKVGSADEAEMQCIINAFHIVNKQKWKDITLINVNTDSMNSIHVFTNSKSEIAKYGLQWATPLRKKLNAVRNSSSYLFKTKVKFTHVKAHVDTATHRTFVNQWCDDTAKTKLLVHIKRIERVKKYLKNE